MEESSTSSVLEGKITGIRFSLATRHEITVSSISDCPISHASQLSNPFLGLPLETGKCESCGTAEPGKCEGHFGYIELPVLIYHPAHINELKRILSLICLKCLKFKNRKFQTKNVGVLERAFASCCEEAAQVTVNEGKTTEGACYLELKVPPKSRPTDGVWDFLDRYGFRYGDGHSRPLLPSEVMAILKKIPAETRRKLAGRGCFFQEGYIMQYLPVPPNCLSVPDVSDGISVMSSDISITMLKKVLKQIEIIKSSRSGLPNFESLEVEVNDLQAAVSQYLQARGTKATRERNTRYGIAKEMNDSSSTKAWLEKMKTLFISKGSGFSSRSVITGDPYKGVGEIGIPFEIAQRITFEERVNEHNMNFLQKLVDDKLCLTYRDGNSTYSLREGSKGHTFLKPGQIVHRKIMEGDVIFINRPPTTHKHSLQALSVYIHDDHTFKINPLICGPLSADFDGDCIHIFYPQSPEAKAEVLELFAVEKQLLSSHSGNVNLQLGTDSLLSLKTMFSKYFFGRAQVQQLALYTSNSLPKPSMLKARHSGPLWTVLELLESSLPRGFDCSGDRFLIRDSKILKLDYNRDVLQSIFNEVVSSIFFSKGPKEVLRLFNSLQPMLMENLCSEGFSLSLEDFIVPKDVLVSIEADLQTFSSLLYHLRSNYNEVIAMQLEKHLREVKALISMFILKFSSMGNLIDSKSDSAVSRIVQQIGFLGLQIMDKGKLYSRTLAEDLASHFLSNYPYPNKYPSEEFGLVRSCLFHGLDPYQEMVHSVASREVMVRSSRGLTEPGTLFKNLMAILRDVVICYDGTVRNVCSNSIIQFDYAVTQSLFAAGEPVGVLAATAMSNPAYKAVLDSSPNSNSSWAMMKEILLCGVNFKNVNNDRRVILYLNDCDCGRKYCLENAAFLVKNHLRKVSLKDVALEFLIEYRRQDAFGGAETDAGLVGHVHLNKMLLKESSISMDEVLTKCQDTLNSFSKKKKVGELFKKITLSFSECSFQQSCESKWLPCLKFFWQNTSDSHLERKAHIFADKICPVLLETIIKGDPRVREANIIWITPAMTAWINNPCKDQKGELAIDVVLEKEAVKKSGDAWRTVLDSCLPVIHLIDTRRSIPYAIKQVEDLLGIACAFEQAVQRLSTSVSMVSKGMLKEHLLLLASSMTCAGTLVGFNQAGIKALSRTLNFQVPFSEATLYTPKKCFEKAAEKCHADSLSSIVAACSWGKPVAVGTGSRFDILWDTRETKLNQIDGIDVYNFLHLVRSGSEEEADSACLGGEVDSYDMEDGDVEMGSPEHNSSSVKPVFEDSSEFNFDEADIEPSKSGWENDPTSQGGGGGWEKVVSKTSNTEAGWSKAEPTNSGGWGATKDADQPAGTWSTWGKKDAKADETGWNTNGSKPPLEEDSSKADAWGTKESWKGQSGSSASWGKAVEKADGPSWNKGGNVASDLDATKAKENERSGKWGSVESDNGAWGQSKQTEPNTGWKKANNDQSGSSGAWGKNNNKVDGFSEKAKAEERSGKWGSVDIDKGHEKSGSWGSTKKDEPKDDVWKKNDWGASNDGDKSGSSAAWGKKVDKTDTPAAERASNWGASDKSGSWGSNKKAEQNDNAPAWKKNDWSASNDGDKSGSSAAWGKKVDKTDTPAAEKASNWGASDKSGAWGSSKKAEEKDNVPAWKKNDWSASNVGDKSGSSAAWGKKIDKTDTPAAEKASERSNNWGAADKSGSWGSAKKAEQNDNVPAWGKKIDKTDTPANEEASGRSSNWGAPDRSSEKSKPWGVTKKAEQKDNETEWKKTDWGASNVGDADKSESGGWNKMVKQKTESKKDGWGSSDAVASGSWGKNEKTNNSDSNDETDKSGNLASKEGEKGAEKSGSWGWNKKVEQKSEPGQGGWKKKEGWGSNKKERPARPVGAIDRGPLTASGQRLDMFTADEQEILAAIEPVMLSIRRIMHQTGYNDGDPLSADDKSYILDNVFNYHPAKDEKMGAGLDYFMINKHTVHQESRCLYIVSTDGRKEDFSYRKCLENFIKEKYPDKVEEFMPKYFRKSQPRQNRERNSGADDGGTPRWKREPTSEAGTPRGWNRDADEAGTPKAQSGWNRESSDEAAGTPKAQTGWNRESSDEAGGTPKARSGWNSVTPDASVATAGWNRESKTNEGGSGWNSKAPGSGSSSGAQGGGGGGSGGWGS